MIAGNIATNVLNQRVAASQRKELQLNSELANRALVAFIKDAVQTTGASGVVLGLSGGVDSALSAALAVPALGPDGVHAIP